jgi:hypothetical protein
MRAAPVLFTPWIDRASRPEHNRAAVLRMGARPATV